MERGFMLDAGLKKLGVELDAEQKSKLLLFLDLLEKWNRTFNLSAVRDRDQMIPAHLLDSLALVPYISLELNNRADGRAQPRLIDVGSGAGLPGIPLSLVFPDTRFTLLDSNGKKTRFLTQAKIELGLGNIEIVNQRIESFQAEEPFDIVISRAFSALSNFFNLTRHLVAKRGKFFAMKGKLAEDELSEVPKNYQIDTIQALEVPFLAAERHLVVACQASGLD